MGREKKLFMVLVGLAVFAFLGSSSFAANLVTNGGFESGNTGFTSAYTYESNLLPAATYYVGSNPSLYNGFWSSFAPYDGSLMMIVNGATTPNVNVWAESGITVVPNTTYYFSAWIASNYPTSPAILDFSINGVQLGSTFTASTTTGLWQQFYATWDSGLNTSANLALVNQNQAFSGNDFSLDDIVLDTAQPSGTSTTTTPEPTTMFLYGLGLVGLAAYRKKSGKA